MTFPGSPGWIVQLDPTDGPNGTNYVPNPSFEYDTVGGVPGTWSSTAQLTSGATLSVVNSAATLQGVQAMKVATGSSASEGASILLNAPSGGYLNGTEYTFSVYVQGNAGGEHITLELGTNANNSTAAIVATTGFAQYSVNWTPSSTAVTGVYALLKGTNATAITFFVDGAMVTLNSVGSTYFDGSTTMAPGSSYSWAGTPGASSSIRANTRTTLDINNPSSGIQIGGTSSGQGPDWGVSSITEYAAQQSRYGSTVADYVQPNRTITIPIVLGNSTVDPNTALQSLREKVALFQREGGWLRRQRNGALNMYADVVDAQLQVPDAWGEGGGVEPSVTLTLMALPDFYGDEITLDSVAATGVYTGVAARSGATATILGDHPSRCPVIVTDTSGNNQLSLIWGVRSKHYDSSATAALFYEAEKLTPLNGAVAVTGVSGASGGSMVTITGVAAATWTSMLVTTIAATTGNWTHQGSYRVWARCYSSTGTPSLQLLWGVGSLSVPVTNTSTTIPATSGFYLLDLGEVRIDGPPVGTAQWLGAIQVYSTAGGDSASIDCIYLQPLDDGAGQLTYVYEAPASSIAVSVSPTTGVNDSSSGTITWANPNNAIAHDGVYTQANLGSPGQVTEWLKLTGFGLAVPASATIQGVQAYRYGGILVASSVRLVKAGTIQSGAPVNGYQDLSPPYDTYGDGIYTWGGPTDLWNGTLSVSDVNSTGFGVALQYTYPGHTDTPIVDWVYLTVYYTLSSGFTVSQDAVIYANQNAHLRHDGMWREAPTGTVYGAVSQVVGDLTRLPPSGIESRPCQLFIKPSRGDLNSLPDSGLDGFTVQPRYQACYIFRP